MGSHVFPAPPECIHQVCERGQFLLMSFVFSATLKDLKGVAEVAVMAGKDISKILFAENDPKHLDFLN